MARSPIELGITRNWPEWFQRDGSLKTMALSEGGWGTTAGQNVNQVSAMNYSAVWAAVSGISKSIASLPCCLYRAESDGERVKEEKHPLFWLVHESPNPTMTPFVFFETLIQHALVTGGGFAEVTRNGAGTPAGLWLVDPNRVQINVSSDGQSISYTDSQTNTPVPARDMIHVPGLGWDGIRGYSVITKARESIGVGLAMEKYGGAYYGNGTALGLVFEHPKTLSQPAHDRLTTNLERRHQGAERAFRPFVAEEGMQVKTVSFSPKDSEFLGSRLFGLEEIARWFDYPVTKLKSKGGERPGGNREVEVLEFVVDCLRPWLIRIEQELNRKLVPMRERPNLYFEFNLEALLRGDSKTRAETYKVYLDMGVIDAEYIAKKENLPKPPKKEPTPVTVPPPAVPEDDPPEDPPVDEEKKAARVALRSLLINEMDKLVRIETNQARRSTEKLDEWYPKHRARLVSLLEPLLRLVSPLAHDSRERAEVIADALCGDHRAALAGGADPLLLERWERECPAEVADQVLGRTA